RQSSDRPRRRESSDRPRRRESSDRPRRYDDRRSSGRSDRRSGGSSEGGSRQEFKAVCSACKRETTLPFKPTGVKPVYCRNCFQDHKPRDDRPRRRESSDRPRQRYDDRRSRDRSDRRTSSRQDFDAVCSACKTEMTLPFKPTGVKPVYCRSCFKKVEAGEKLTPIVEENVERFGDREGPYRENKRMHKTHCRQCNDLILVPFKPKKNKLIYCPDCYTKVSKESNNSD
ncbi:MAG: CxxC-x17-CxxC domain-containing protein, partial [Candidatus Heimdallarchaeaceae archaeon]